MASTLLKDFRKKLKSPLDRRATFKRLREYNSRPRSLEERVQWAMDFGGHGLYKIRTIQRTPEITALARAVAELKPKVVLEIGTARAGTLLLWSALASEEVISCDIQDMSRQEELYRSLVPGDSNCRVTLLSGDSHSDEFRDRVAKVLNGRKVDFLFIDGDHTLDGVTVDYQNYKDFVRSGGIIGFHDIVEDQPWPGNQVFHLWKNLRTEFDYEEFIEDPNQCGYGIGIIRVP